MVVISYINEQDLLIQYVQYVKEYRVPSISQNILNISITVFQYTCSSLYFYVFYFKC